MNNNDIIGENFYMSCEQNYIICRDTAESGMIISYMGTQDLASNQANPMKQEHTGLDNDIKS